MCCLLKFKNAKPIHLINKTSTSTYKQDTLNSFHSISSLPLWIFHERPNWIFNEIISTVRIKKTKLP